MNSIQSNCNKMYLNVIKTCKKNKILGTKIGKEDHCTFCHCWMIRVVVVVVASIKWSCICSAKYHKIIIIKNASKFPRAQGCLFCPNKQSKRYRY